MSKEVKTVPKAPTAPTAPKSKPQAPKPKPTANVSITPQQQFWVLIKEIREQVKMEGFGKASGGRDYKDTKGLKHFVRPLFEKVDIHYYISPKDVNLEPTQHINPKTGALDSHYIVFGSYDVKWFLGGEVVFETTAYGSTNINSASMATQGSLTNATTSALYTLLQAETQSEEEMERKLNQEQNKQQPRQAAITQAYGQPAAYGQPTPPINSKKPPF